MTNIKICYLNNDIVGVECSNHSGFAESGKDIVCAGISCITQTAILGLEKIAKVDFEYKIDERRGYLSIKIKDMDEKKFHDAQVILKTMLCGLKDLEKQYPKYLKLEG